VSILGGRGGAIGAAIGTLTVNFLDTGLVFNVTPAYIVQLCLGVLLIVVIMFQTGSHLLDLYQKRRALLTETDRRRVELRPKIAQFRGEPSVPRGSATN
jgi:ribose transport system permease protein